MKYIIYFAVLLNFADRDRAKMYEDLEKFVLRLCLEETLNILFCSGDRRVYSALANFLLSTADNSLLILTIIIIIKFLVIDIM